MANPAKRVYLGDGPPYVQMHGMPSNIAWESSPFDMGEMDDISCTISALTETPVASLYIPSATGVAAGGFVGSQMGLLWVAQTPGAGGNSISVTQNAPSGSSTTFSVTTDAITISPALGLTNGQLCFLAQQKATVWALVKPFIMGWQPTGPVGNTFMAELLEGTRNDLVLAQTVLSLAGGAATAAVNGTLTLQGSDDLVNWQAFTDATATGVLTSSTSPLRLNSQRPGCGFVRLAWKPQTGSVGQLFADWTFKGGAR
jgi:hypothetical protein